MSSNKPTIALVATAGGHLTELQALAEAYSAADCYYITDRFSWTARLAPACRIPRWGGLRWPALSLLLYVGTAAIMTLWCFARRRPDVIISTGAEIAVPAFWLGKLFGARCVYIESVTRFDELSLSARLVLPVADIVYAQQKSLARRYPGKVRFAGSIL